MSEIMLIGGAGGLEYRLGRFTDDVVRVPLVAAFEPGFNILDSLDLERLPDVVMLGPEIDHETMLVVAATIDALPEPPAVVAVTEPSPKLVLDAMRVGIRDVIDPDAPDEEFEAVLRWARDRAGRRLAPTPAHPHGPSGRVVVVAAPKGGVGKSTMAVNIAVDLARQAPSQVVIVDLDLRFGDVATMLNLAPDHSITDVFASRGGLDTLLLKTYLTAHASGLWVISAPESPAAADQVEGQQVSQLLQVLAREFAYVVVDTGSGLDEHTMVALEQATDAVFVASMDVSGVRNMRKEVELLSAVGVVPPRQHLVLNLADKRSGMRAADVATAIGLPISAVVPRAPEVLLATNKGVPMLSAKKARGSAAQAMRSVVKALTTTAVEPEAKHTAVLS